MKPSPVTNALITSMRVMLVILITFFTVRTFAQDKSESPYFFILSNAPGVDQLPLKQTRADVKIAGVIADVTITQEYQNAGDQPLEAIYTFPGSANAAVYAMEMKIGERIIRANIREKAKAREQYDQAKREGKRASLLEQHRPNVFTMNVANIMPGDVITVTLRYTEVLVPDEGTYTFVYPAVVGPRYAGEQSNGTQTSFVSNPHTRKGVLPSYDFYVDVNLSAGMPVQHVASTTHQIAARFTGSDKVHIRLDPNETQAGNRDFILEYKLAGNEIASGLMLYEHGDENFFMLMVQPPKRVVKEQIPPREYIFIVDVSGSMHGFPLQTTKTLLNNLITNLKPDDRFNVLVFESGAHWLADVSLHANAGNIQKAVSFLDCQQGGGGTRLLHAMTKALSFPRHTDGLSRSFIVVTDGYVHVEREVFDLIRARSDEANVFAFGIGSSVNRYIVDGIAHTGQSEPFVVLNPSGADRVAEKFRKYINTPVLTGIRTSYSGFEAYDVEPLSVPDVLAERPVVIFGKYKGKPSGTITVEGMSGQKKFTKTFHLNAVNPEKDHGALRYLWARKKVQLLDDYRRIGSGDDATAREVTALGLQYSMLTNYTSFVAVENVPVNGKGTTTVKQPLPMPAGVDDSAIGFDAGLDSVELDISFHRSIILPAILDSDTRKKVEASIEKKMLLHVNRYIAEHNIDIGRIEITVGIDGGIVKATFTGKNLSVQHQQELMKLILQHGFEKFRILQAWKFTVVF